MRDESEDDDQPMELERPINWGKFVGGFIIFAIPISFCGFLLIKSHAENQQAAREAAEKQYDFDASVAALVSKYNAVTNWPSLLPSRAGQGKLYSADVSKVLIPSNGQPVMMRMELADVREKNGIFTALFNDDIGDGVSHVNFGLTCTPEQANYLLNQGTNDFTARYFVVARVKNVERPRIKAEISGAGEDASIDFDTSSDIFFADGECLDLVREIESPL